MNGLSLADFWELFWPSLTASLLASVLCGALGVFVVLRRVAFVSAALGQVSGLGVALGFLVGSAFGVDPHEQTPLYLDPVVLALVLTGALSTVLSVTGRAQRTSPESAVAFSYLVAAALALVALASPRIVQEAHEVNDLLFGSTVAVRQEHLVELAVVAAGVLLAGAFYFQDLVFASFDREMARTVGLPVGRLEAGLNLAIGVSVAVATRAVGALPVFGFLVLPAGAALIGSERMGRLPWLAAGISATSALAGFYLSYVENWPTGPLMVLCAAASWPLAWGLRKLSAR